MKPRNFFLIKYEEIIPIFKKLDEKLNKEAFLDCYKKVNNLINSSKQIQLDEDSLTGWEKGSIFINADEYIEKIEFEILRPITSRQIGCFRNALNVLYSNSEYYKNKEKYEHDSLLELSDCVMDYNRCYKKEYISYSEYLLFKELLEIFDERFKYEK